jgi:hypothetical protein
MSISSNELVRLEIDLNSEMVPPPYSHTIELKIKIEPNFLNVVYDLVYTQREDLTEDEIFEEGFTIEDDYHYKGEISKAWEKPLKELYSKSKWAVNKKLIEENGGIQLLAKDKSSQIRRSVPINQSEWQIFTQEIIQAIYETNQTEAPLTIRYLMIRNNEKSLHTITAKFSLRKIDFDTNGKKIDMPWEEVKMLLADVYLPDYDYDQAQEKQPQKNGEFIDCGDGWWHELGKGVINIDPEYDAISKIKQFFRKLNNL